MAVAAGRGRVRCIVDWMVVDPSDHAKDHWAIKENVFCRATLVGTAGGAGASGWEVVQGVYGIGGPGSASLGTFVGGRVEGPEAAEDGQEAVPAYVDL